jgi:hypothetical protein
MTDSIHLIGAEDVARAGSAIASAAEDMRRTQGWLDESLQRSNNRFEESVARIEAAAEKVAKASERPRYEGTGQTIYLEQLDVVLHDLIERVYSNKQPRQTSSGPGQVVNCEPDTTVIAPELVDRGDSDKQIQGKLRKRGAIWRQGLFGWWWRR